MRDDTTGVDGRWTATVRGWIYNRLIADLTTSWYREVLSRLPYGARVLDVGIGTGAALARCADVVRAKDLQVVGLDIDPDYLERCRGEMARAGLTEHVQPVLASVYDHDDGPYDAVYFSASLMLLPDPVAAIAHTAGLLSPQGTLFSTQTFHHRRSALRERLKPLLHRVTTIHFGRVTYVDELRDAFAAAGVELVELTTMSDKGSSSYRLAVGRVRDAADGPGGESAEPVGGAVEGSTDPGDGRASAA